MKSIKIFVANKTIELTGSKSIQTKSNGMILLTAKMADTKLVQLIVHFLTQQLIENLVIIGNSASLLKIFQSNFKSIEAAGGIIENSNKKLLFIFRMGKWDLPKGKIDKRETPEQAAIRECEEECAVSGLHLVKKIADTWHMYMIGKEWVIKRTHWYLMFTEFTGKLKPQREEGIEKAEWMTISKTTGLLKKSYPAIAELMNSYYQLQSKLAKR